MTNRERHLKAAYDNRMRLHKQSLAKESALISSMQETTENNDLSKYFVMQGKN